ncbi:MAG: exodeoxyribonuclease VII large subunit [Clostridiales bacterium]|nr:exodeoxyribonuclease VII large subunit [Clostridiales bacterium]
MTREMTVTQLATYLSGVFEDEELLHDVMLSGEVAEVSYSDKHTFLTLADGNYSVRCAHFSARDNLEKGAKVALRGSVSFYDRRASVTFVYKEFYVSGGGQKNAEFLKLKEKLRADGLFENRKQLPKYVLSVAVITSPDGAAIRDFIRVTNDYCSYVDIRVVPSRMQGDGAAEMIVNAVKKLQGSRFDAIILCRGGGSDEDLDCFNNENLAVTVAHSDIPIVSAVGHEIDYTLCDFCAGTRAGTPSIAGQIIGTRAAALWDDLTAASVAAWNALYQKHESRRRALDRLGLRIVGSLEARAAKLSRAPEALSRRGMYALEKKCESDRRRVNDAANALKVAAERFITKKRVRAEKLSGVLAALDPNKVRSGFAAVYKDGRAVGSSAELKRGDQIKLVFADGEAFASVTEVDNKRR